MTDLLRPGADVRVRDVSGEWYPATATSGVEGTHRHGKKVHDFAVVWVRLAAGDGPVPWPADAVVRTDGGEVR